MDWKFDTLSIHGGFQSDENGAALPPIYQSTSFVFRDSDHAARVFNLEEDGFIYTRINNPTLDVLEKRMALLEGGVGAVAAASGMAAITMTMLSLLKEGDEIVAASTLYGGTVTLFNLTLSRLGIKTTFVDPDDPENFRRAITEKTRVVYLETIGNPKLNIPDFEKIVEIAHSIPIPVVVDNTAATPYLFKPFDWGIDIAVYSMTKYLSGHATSIAGIIVDSGNFPWKEGGFTQFTEPDPGYHGIIFTEKFGKRAFIERTRLQVLRDIGGALSPFNAFLILLGMETLSLRMDKHSSNALKVARFLEGHPAVERVNYPGLESSPYRSLAEKYLPVGQSGLVGFELKGGYEAGKKFISRVRLLKHLANIGDARSLVIHPASTTHQQLSREERLKAGVTDGFIRLSVGIEDPDDIISDIDQALEGL